MGTAIFTKGADVSASSNHYFPPVETPLVWGNFETDALRQSRRLTNWGSLAGTFTLSGIAQLVAKGIAAAAGTDSRITLGTFTPDAFSLVALVDVGESAGIFRHRNIRISTDASKKLQRIMDAGFSNSGITAPSTGAFVVFLNGDATGHAYGLLTSSSVQKSTSTAANTSTTATWLGGNNQAGVATAWAAYGTAFYDRKLSDNELILVAERLINRARALGVTVNG
ncbi:hypothetical protein J9A50_23460 [Klebsiella pneumoniae]|uniref:Uncharacterized protein n=1 Tax=Klebsiella huaxiensis TaxID=2153354 RepID=A0ABT6EBT0_9ENTR|nr:hypothetical protein [Klebsiella huaxiensis]MDG1642004.1 hypothetical protein [Klebsiella huaxiensis]HDG7582557.1 hypothetical protein [Klebsiella pneumoniae]